MARGLPFTYGPSRTALESSTARAMGVIMKICKVKYYIQRMSDYRRGSGVWKIPPIIALVRVVILILIDARS